MVYDKSKFNAKSSNTSIVIQFTILANSDYICNLLKRLEINGIHICALYLSEDKYSNVKFKCVVDKGNSQSFNNLDIVRNILDDDNIEYYETKVVKVTSYSSYSSLASQYCTLSQSLSIYSFYLGENGSIIFETCCPTKTIQALSRLF